jgi:hypothetical protein
MLFPSFHDVIGTIADKGHPDPETNLLYEDDGNQERFPPLTTIVSVITTKSTPHRM